MKLLKFNIVKGYLLTWKTIYHAFNIIINSLLNYILLYVHKTYALVVCPCMFY
jgi:hypothetical protein